MRRHRPAESGNFLRGGRGANRIDVEDRDRGADAGKCGCRCASDAAAAAGDQGHLAVEAKGRERVVGDFGHVLSPSNLIGANTNLGCSRQNQAATISVAPPVSRNSPGTLTPTAINAIVATAAMTIAAALITLLAAIARARWARALAACNKHVKRHDKDPARHRDPQQIDEDPPMRRR